MQTLYGYPYVGRSGLGNCLFPWARCWLWCRAHSIPMLAPDWKQIRIGPYLRGERDKRQYHRLFRPDRYIAGPLRLAVLTASRSVAESAVAPDRRPSWPTVVRFSGVGDYFLELAGQSQSLLDELRAYAKPERVPHRLPEKPYVAVHVRRGDFSSPQGNELLRGGHNYRIDLEWYKSAIATLRHELGHPVPVELFTDGTSDEVAPLLELEHVSLRVADTAIEDLLLMSGAGALIASGSSFSIWASYLAQCPTIWHRGQRRGGATSIPAFEPEWMPGERLPAEFVVEASARLGV